MDLRNVNVASIRAAINDLIKNLSYESLENAFKDTASNDSWASDAKESFRNGLIVNKNCMDMFKDLLNNALNICSQIEEWQQLYKDIFNHSLIAATYNPNPAYRTGSVTTDPYTGLPLTDSKRQMYYYAEMAIIKDCQEKQYNIENNIKTSLPLTPVVY